tara:strand:+ start:7340 stop:8896 length:1557 start_codon:yes stop_codon:yes gene_type:complete
MSNSLPKILWIDDEIDLLRPHILLLEEKGYDVAIATTGKEGLGLIKDQNFDLVLIDQFMPGDDGIETSVNIKSVNPSVPIIMITKSEEEWLIDEAIYKKIDRLLIKPVNPNQIYAACKQVLESANIFSEKSKNEYLSQFKDTEDLAIQASTVEEWWKIYSKLVKWQIDFDVQREESLVQILKDQFNSVNKIFSQFIINNYPNWLNDNDRPTLSCDIFIRNIKPLLVENKKTCLLVMDAMRLDQFVELNKMLSEDFSVEMEPSLSLIPSATPFSRNAIFSGLFADEMCELYPKQRNEMIEDKGSLNNFEKEFLNDQMKKNGLSDKKMHYHKIWIADEGKRFLTKINNFTNNDLLAIVVNFVDQLAHRRSESDVLKEMVPDEGGYRKAVGNWYAKSWIKDVLHELSLAGYSVIMTSDHGSVMVAESASVAADKSSSDGIRYKHGTNINTSDRKALDIRDLDKYRLPELGVRTNYLIAKENYYFIYPNQERKYRKILENSFQHGGISIEEMLVPILTMKPK